MGVGSVGVGVLGTEDDVGVLGTEGRNGTPAAALVMGFASNSIVEIVAILISAKRALETMMSPF
eukprot:1364372-Rhodomonas_salina.1